MADLIELQLGDGRQTHVDWQNHTLDRELTHWGNLAQDDCASLLTLALPGEYD